MDWAHIILLKNRLRRYRKYGEIITSNLCDMGLTPPPHVISQSLDVILQQRLGWLWIQFWPFNFFEVLCSPGDGLRKIFASSFTKAVKTSINVFEFLRVSRLIKGLNTSKLHRINNILALDATCWNFTPRTNTSSVILKARTISVEADGLSQAHIFFAFSTVCVLYRDQNFEKRPQNFSNSIFQFCLLKLCDTYLTSAVQI